MTFSGHSFKDRASNQSLIEVSRHPVVNVLERRIDFGCRAGLEGLPVLDGRLSAIHEIRCALALRSSTELGRPDVAPWGFAIAMLRSRRQYPSSGKSPPKYRASLGGQSHIRVLSWLPLRVSQNEIAVVPPDSPSRWKAAAPQAENAPASTAGECSGHGAQKASRLRFDVGLIRNTGSMSLIRIRLEMGLRSPSRRKIKAISESVLRIE
jgi:hypothetical protein